MSLISAHTKQCLIIGDPVAHSLSPRMHNAAYNALGIDDEYVFTAARVSAQDTGSAVAAVRTLGIRGLTCTIPHKEMVMQYLDHIDPVAHQIGAVNTVVNTEGVLTGYNTDWLGVVRSLEAVFPEGLSGKTAVVIGAGGAARAMVFGLLQKKVLVTVCNRTPENAQHLAEEAGAQFCAMDDTTALSRADILLNATALGMGENQHRSPIPQEVIHAEQVVFDAVYAPRETRLITEAKEQNATVIYGLEMLLHQGTAQFSLYTNREAPISVMRQILEKS